MTKRRWIVIILFPLTLLQLWGLDPNTSVDQYLLDQWETSDGLPSNAINSIVQTPDGYLWLAGSNGLVRFDGIKFSNIPFVSKEEISPIETAEPITLLINRDGDLWIGSTIGITRFRNGQFRTFTPGQGLSENRIRFIYEDMRGNLWISFKSGYVDRLSDGKFTPFNDSHGLDGKRISAIVEDRSGNLLFATREKGVFIFREGQFSRYPVPGLDNLQIITMYLDHKEELWIGTTIGLLRFNKNGTVRYSSIHGLSHDYIMVITEDIERNLWVGTLKGLNRLKRKPDGTIGFESLLQSITVFSLFEDREKSLWIGTEKSGLNRLKDSKFTSFAVPKALQKETISSIFRDREGGTWIGSLGGKLFHFRENHLLETIKPPGLTGTGISAIARDNKGNLWLGTMGKGIFQKKDGTFVPFTTREGLADNLVTSIYKDSQGNLWFSTFAGVNIIRTPGNDIETFTAHQGLEGNMVRNIYEDRSHNIWITTDQGITVLKKGKTARQNIKYYLKGIPAVSIYEDPSPPKGEGTVLWISTDGAGLKRLRLEDDRIYSYTVEQGMATDTMYQFFEEQDNFWLMSNKGILRVSKKELNLLAKGEIDRINCTSFGKAEGMQSTEFHNELSHHSALQTRDGELWFVTKKGISILNPKKIHVNKLPPPVVIEEVYFDRQAIPLHQDKNVFKDIKDFSFHFTALTFLSPKKVKFQYQLEGFDKELNYLPPGSKRFVYYQNLEPGTYTFKVTACNSEGIWNKTGASITFYLKPLFHQTFIFKVVVFLLPILLVAAAVYIYIKRPFDKKKKTPGLQMNPQFAKVCTKKLYQLMEVEKVYRDEKISIQSLAKQLSIPPYQLSQLLNEKMNQSFPDFINSYRIEEAKEILTGPEGKEKKNVTVAFDVGFNSVAAFYRAFKKFTGMTPQQYKKENQ
jgi:ligand-binding sensor domain-containing protein/AraC-like DNA-binding protein